MAEPTPPLVDQPNPIAPTRKVVAFAASAAIVSVAMRVWERAIERLDWLDWINTPEVQALLPLGIGFGAAWLFRDRDNTPEVTPVPMTGQSSSGHGVGSMMSLLLATVLLFGCAGGQSALDLSTPEGRCAAARVGLAAASIILDEGEDEGQMAERLAKAAALVELYCAIAVPLPERKPEVPA